MVLVTFIHRDNGIRHYYGETVDGIVWTIHRNLAKRLAPTAAARVIKHSQTPGPLETQPA